MNPSGPYVIVNNYTYANMTLLQGRIRSCLSTSPAYLLLEERSCYDVCPRGYLNNTSLLYCYNCYIDCATCNGSLPENCTTCPVGKLLTSGRCLCPSGMASSLLGDCLHCDLRCQSCATTPINCLSCDASTYRALTINNTCDCMAGYIDSGNV
jgi:hypothetical protein